MLQHAGQEVVRPVREGPSSHAGVVKEGCGLRCPRASVQVGAAAGELGKGLGAKLTLQPRGLAIRPAPSHRKGRAVGGETQGIGEGPVDLELAVLASSVIAWYGPQPSSIASSRPPISSN